MRGGPVRPRARILVSVHLGDATMRRCDDATTRGPRANARRGVIPRGRDAPRFPSALNDDGYNNRVYKARYPRENPLGEETREKISRSDRKLGVNRVDKAVLSAN